MSQSLKKSIKIKQTNKQQQNKQKQQKHIIFPTLHLRWRRYRAIALNDQQLGP